MFRSTATQKTKKRRRRRSAPLPLIRHAVSIFCAQPLFTNVTKLVFVCPPVIRLPPVNDCSAQKGSTGLLLSSFLRISDIFLYRFSVFSCRIYILTYAKFHHFLTEIFPFPLSCRDFPAFSSQIPFFDRPAEFFCFPYFRLFFNHQKPLSGHATATRFFFISKSRPTRTSPRRPAFTENPHIAHQMNSVL